MTWPLFAVLQIALTLVGAVVVFALHHRRIASENDALRAACESVAGGSGSPAEWLAERVQALEGDDPQIAIQRLVLQNEVSEISDFADQLAGLLGAPEAAQSWANLRAAAWQQAAESGDDASRQAFEFYAPIDEQLGYTPEPWPEAEAPAEEEPASDVLSAEDVDDLLAGAEAEPEEEPTPEGEPLDAQALLAENEALKEELELLRGQGHDEDLRKLLKQFTQDSREMMGCIQELEKENAELRAQLGQDAAA